MVRHHRGEEHEHERQHEEQRGGDRQGVHGHPVQGGPPAGGAGGGGGRGGGLARQCGSECHRSSARKPDLRRSRSEVNAIDSANRTIATTQAEP